MMYLCIMRAMPWNLEGVTVKLHEQDEQRDGLDSLLQHPPTDRGSKESLMVLPPSPSVANANGTVHNLSNGSAIGLGQAQHFREKKPLTAIIVFLSKTLTITEWEVRK